MLDRLTVDDFVPWVGHRFELMVDGEVHGAELAWATASGEPPPPGSGRRHTFSIGLRTARDLRLPQRIHTVVHPRLGRLDIFLVPVQPDSTGSLFEAVFS